METGLPLILYGAESIFTVEMLETARRVGRPIVGVILAGEPEWVLIGLPVEPSHALEPSLLALEFVVPWVTPGMRWQRAREALDAGLLGHSILIDPGST